MQVVPSQEISNAVEAFEKNKCKKCGWLHTTFLGWIICKFSLVRSSKNDLTCKCGSADVEAMPCPYDLEINEASTEDAMCMCCDSCRKQCLESI